jgi:hypothetical protein
VKRVIILARGPGWSAAPKPTPEVPVWGTTCILGMTENVSKVFEIHDLVEKLNRPRAGWLHQEAIHIAMKRNIPYVVREHWNFLPGLQQEVYPWKEVFNHFGIDYMGCSLCLMIALALYEGYDSIHMYGNGQHRQSEYDNHLSSVAFWIGVMFGKGIDFYMHHYGGVKHTDLLTTTDGLVYGLNEPQSLFPHTNTVDRCTCRDSAYKICNAFGVDKCYK